MTQTISPAGNSPYMIGLPVVGNGNRIVKLMNSSGLLMRVLTYVLLEMTSQYDCIDDMKLILSPGTTVSILFRTVIFRTVIT